jgi:hypothetical protein
MPDGRVSCPECRRENGILLLAAETRDARPFSAAIMLHCVNCDQHFRLSLKAAGNHVDMGWESFPCPVDPCPYAEAHKASHES